MLVGILDFVFSVISILLNLLVWALILNAIISWLVAFDVINLRNRAMSSIAYFLDAVTRPILRPFQRIIPVLGGVDVSPVVAIIIIGAFNAKLLPPIANSLSALVGGPPIL